jgi:hypothetical protein
VIPPAHYYYSYFEKNIDEDDGKYLNYNLGD